MRANKKIKVLAGGIALLAAGMCGHPDATIRGGHPGRGCIKIAHDVSLCRDAPWVRPYKLIRYFIIAVLNFYRTAIFFDILSCQV